MHKVYIHKVLRTRILEIGNGETKKKNKKNKKKKNEEMKVGLNLGE